MLKQKWLQKGCNKQIIDDVLSQFDFSEIAIKVASKLLRKYQGKLPSKALKDKLTQSLINKGLSNQEISDKVVISVSTVKKHIYNIYNKTGVSSRGQLISLFLE